MTDDDQMKKGNDLLRVSHCPFYLLLLLLSICQNSSCSIHPNEPTSVYDVTI